MNAVEFLTRQHRQIEHYFDRLSQIPLADVGARADVFARLIDAIALHTALEEDHVYPRAASFCRVETCDVALAEHQELKEKLADLIATDLGDPSFGAKLLGLRDTLEIHVEAEESEIFAELEERLERAELLDLGLELAEAARERHVPPDGELSPALDPTRSE